MSLNRAEVETLCARTLHLHRRRPLSRRCRHCGERWIRVHYRGAGRAFAGCILARIAQMRLAELPPAPAPRKIPKRDWYR